MIVLKVKRIEIQLCSLKICEVVSNNIIVKKLKNAVDWKQNTSYKEVFLKIELQKGKYCTIPIDSAFPLINFFRV